MEVGLPGRTQMDKLCEICGATGYVESLATCFLCKKTSQHIYCMDNKPGSEVWYCDGCSRISPQANFDKVSCVLTRPSARDASRMMPKICKSKRSSAVHSRFSKNVVHPFSHNALKRVETAKVKFISADEAALLTTKAKSRVYDARGSLQTLSASDARRKTHNMHVNQRVMLRPETRAMPCDTHGDRHHLLHQTAEANTVPSIPGRTSNVPIGVGSKTHRTLSPPKGAVNAEKTRLSLPKCSVIMKRKERKMKNNRASGNEACVPLRINETMEGSTRRLEYESDVPPWPSNEKRIRNTAVEKVSTATATMKKSVEMHVNAGIRESPSKCVRYLESKCDIGGAPPDRSGEDPFAELRTECGSEVGLYKTCVADKMLGGLNNKMPRNFLSTGGSGITAPSDAQLKSFVPEVVNLSTTLLMNPDMKTHWKGTFDISSADFDVCCGIQGYFPPQVSYKAYECSKLMPGKLKFKVVPRLSAWPKTFHMDPPSNDDIGLYFLPSEMERFEQIYAHVVMHMDFCDFALQSFVANVELLIYTSKQLPMDNQRLPSQKYLWGIFRHMRPKKHDQNVETVPSDSKLDAPPGFPKLVSGSASHGKKPLVIPAPKNEATPIISDFPPSFHGSSTSRNESSSSNAASMQPPRSRKEVGLTTFQASGDECKFDMTCFKSSGFVENAVSISDRGHPMRAEVKEEMELRRWTSRRQESMRSEPSAWVDKVGKVKVEKQNS